jgi:hypothetical protein
MELIITNSRYDLLFSFLPGSAVGDLWVNLDTCLRSELSLYNVEKLSAHISFRINYEF